MRDSELDRERSPDGKTNLPIRSSKPRSCIVSTGFYDSCSGFGEKTKQTRTHHKSRSVVGNNRRNYQSLVLQQETTTPKVSARGGSDSGISWNSSIVNCLESQLHFIPTWFDDEVFEFSGTERRLRSHRNHSINCRSLTRSSVIFTDYDSSVKLCQSCNTYYEVPHHYPETGRNLRYQDLDIPTKICNVFWKLQLTMSSFSYGDGAVDFASLWPSEQCIGGILLEACSTSSALVQSLCRFVTLCGPVFVLRTLLNLNIIGLNHTFENGFGLLHMSCLAQNMEAVIFLLKAGVNPTLRDLQGCTAAQLCHSPAIFGLLPAACHSPSPSSHSVASKFKKSPPTLLDKRKIFEMARNAADTEKLLVMLQTLEFDINAESDDTGDFVVHIAVKEGISQVPLLILLVKLFRADINRQNKAGLTCLMLAASMGVTALVDLLLCVFNANPDCHCYEKKWTALHFACYEQHLNVVSILLKRGADCSREDGAGCRPDDIAQKCGAGDCQQAIEEQRKKFIRHLKFLVKENKLDDLKKLPSGDLYIISDSGRTIVTWAVKYDRTEVLEFLLIQLRNRNNDGRQIRKQELPTLINAQHLKTLQTALAYAVIRGRRFAVELLMRFGADPRICDIQNYTPLHHAVVKGDIETTKILLQFNTSLMELQKALDLTKDEELIVHLKAACKWRQTTIVNPELFENSVSGNSDRLYCVLERGDRVNPFSGVGDWPVYLAATNGHLEVLKLLLEFGGDYWSVHSSNGNTVLHVACANNHEDIVTYLITKYEETKEMSRLLTDHLNLFNFSAKTPLMLAAETGNTDLVFQLLGHGASTSVLTPSGELFHCDHFAGVQFVLERHHKRHCEEIFEAIYDKKGLKTLTNIFLPFHDHNLRDPKSGDTPLMTAARLGKIKFLEFLLRSSSYSMFKKSESVNSQTGDGGSLADGGNFSDTADEDAKDSSDENQVDPSLCAKSSDHRFLSRDSLMFEANLSSLLGNISSICPQNPVLLGNKISQTCAINSADRSTVFHRVVENGDWLVLLNVLLEGDRSEVNMQNAKGYSPLHLAMRLNRRKIVQRLTALPFVDINLRTLDGSLAEDLTSNTSLKSLVFRARNQHHQTSYPRCPLRSVANSVSGVDRSVSHESEPVNFDWLNAKFAKLKETCHAPYL